MSYEHLNSAPTRSVDARSELEAAKEFLLSILAAGPVESSIVKRSYMDEEISTATFNRAVSELNAKAFSMGGKRVRGLPKDHHLGEK